MQTDKSQQEEINTYFDESESRMTDVETDANNLSPYPISKFECKDTFKMALSSTRAPRLAQYGGRQTYTPHP